MNSYIKYQSEFTKLFPCKKRETHLLIFSLHNYWLGAGGEEGRPPALATALKDFSFANFVSMHLAIMLGIELDFACDSRSDIRQGLRVLN